MRPIVIDKIVNMVVYFLSKSLAKCVKQCQSHETPAIMNCAYN